MAADTPPALRTCESCEGEGRVLKNTAFDATGPIAIVECPGCAGAGTIVSESLEFDFGGCKLTDEGSVEDIGRVIGGEARYMGKRGVVEAMWLIEGAPPWPGPPFPRPLYRVRWRQT